MPSFKLSPFIVAAAILAVRADEPPTPVSTFPATPLADKHIAYTAIVSQRLFLLVLKWV